MKNLLFPPCRITCICMLLFLVISHNTYSQDIPVVVRANSKPTSSLQVPEDAISLAFRVPKGRSSHLEIEVLEFKNGKEVKEERRSNNINVSVNLNPENTFLLDVYETDNGIVRVSKTKVGVYATTTKIDSDTGEHLKCVSLGVLGNIYDRTIVVALVYDSTKVGKKEIEAILTDIRSAEKNDVETIKARWSVF